MPTSKAIARAKNSLAQFMKNTSHIFGQCLIYLLTPLTYKKAPNLKDKGGHNPGYSCGIEYGKDRPPPGIGFAFYSGNSSYTGDIEQTEDHKGKSN